jgi:hypothetical protein
MLLHGRYRHNALMCVLQILAGFSEVTVRARAAAPDGLRAESFMELHR